MSAEEMIEHRGGCHCGRVRFTVRAPAVISVSQCNCGVCAASGHLGLIVPRDRFTLKTGEQDLTEYRFNTGTAKHLFCKYCGIKSFYVPRSHPDGVSVNARCLERDSIIEMNITEFDGLNWEQHYPKGRAESFPK
jgi:hypothetical protein